MPKLSKPTPKQVDPCGNEIKPDDPDYGTKNFHVQGMAVALADLAQQLGMSVADATSFAHHVKGAGLPFPVPHHIAHAAHRIDRDRIDGMLWRCHGRKASEPIPQVTRQQATKQVESVNTARTTGTVVAGAPGTDTTI